MAKIDKSILSVSGVADYLGFSTTKIYRLLKAGAIPAAKIGGQYRFHRAAIDSWLNGGPGVGHETGPAAGRGVVHAAAPATAPAPAHLAAAPGHLPAGPRALERVRVERDPLARNLLLVGFLAREVAAEGVRPVVVGGQAVEFYTAGGYATPEIALVVPDTAAIGRVLGRWGFRRAGRTWTLDDPRLSVELRAGVPDGDEARLTEVEIEGLRVHLAGVEDTIVERLKALVSGKAPDDGAWVREMALLNRDEIEWGYLERRAGAAGVFGAARKLRREAAGR